MFVMGIVFSLFLDRLVTGETPEGINVQIVFFIQLFNVICSYLFFAYKTSVNKRTALRTCLKRKYIKQIYLLICKMKSRTEFVYIALLRQIS